MSGALFDMQANEVEWPGWFTPSKHQPTCARNVTRGLHPTGVTLGPADQTCGSCEHRVQRIWSRAYWKCGRGKMTRCVASDIRMKWRACMMWEPEA